MLDSPVREQALRLFPAYEVLFSTRWPWRLALAIAFGLFAWQCLAGGLPRFWDPDSALYILNAQGIVRGDDYGASLFVANPLNPIHPGSYPPGLPLLLAPVLWAQGLDLGAIALVTYACFCGLVVATFLVARLALSPWASLGVTVLVAFNPLFGFVADGIYSEYPFMLAAYAAFICLEVASAHRQATPRVARLMAALGGLLVGYAVLVRTVGFLLLLAIALAAAIGWLRGGRDWRRLDLAMIAIACGTASSVAVMWWMPHDTATYVSYVDLQSVDALLASMREGLRAYLTVVPEEMLSGRMLSTSGLEGAALLSWVVAWPLFLLAALGFLRMVIRRSSVIEAFTLLYAAFILVYPIRFEPSRYALPLLPLFVMYAVLGLDWLLARSRPRRSRIIRAVSATAVAIAYAPTLLGPAYLLPTPWVTSHDAEVAFDAIRSHTPRSALLLASDPTSVALFADRRATVWPAKPSDAEVLDHVRAAGVTHLLLRPPASPVDDADFERFMAANDAWLEPVWEGPGFALVAVRPVYEMP